MEDINVFTSEEASELGNTQQIRKTLINKLTNDGTTVPERGQVFLLGLLDGADRSTLSRAKLRHDKVKDDNMKDTVNLVADILRSVNTRNYRPQPTAAQRALPPELSREFVPGEMEIGNEPLTAQQVIQD